MASEWYFQLGASALGPVTAGSLLERAGDGRLSPADAIRKGADGKWVARSECKDSSFATLCRRRFRG